jgi:hypothetical protein
MNEKTTKNTKAELLKMLTDAVLNTPGSSRIEPVVDAPTKPKRGSAPKRVAKIKGVRALSGRKQGRR